MGNNTGYKIDFIGSGLKNYYEKLKDGNLDINYFKKIEDFIKFLNQEKVCLEQIVLFTYTGTIEECNKIVKSLNDFFEYFFLVVPSVCVIDNLSNISDFSPVAKNFDYVIDLSTSDSEIEAIASFVYLKKREGLERKKYELINQAVVLDLYEEFIKNGKKDIPVFYYGVDHDGILKTIDDGMLKILGFSKEEIIGRHFSDLIANEELEKVGKAFRERRTGDRGAKGIHLKLKRKDGGYSEFIVDSQGVHIPTIREKPDKEPSRLYVGTFGRIRGVKTQEINKINIDFFNVTNEPVFIYEIEDHRLILNHGSEKFLGYSQAEVADKDPSFFEKDEYSYFSKALENLKEKNHVEYATVIVKKSGESVSCDVSIDQIKFGDKHYLVGIYQDITDFINFINKADSLIQLTSLMVSSKTKEELIKMASEEIINILDVLYLGVALWNNRKGTFDRAYITDKSSGEFINENRILSYGEYLSVMKESIHENVIRYFEMNREVESPFGNKNKKVKAGDFISIPLTINGNKLGCMFIVTDYFHSYTLKDIRMMELSGHVLSSGIYRYELESQLKKNLDMLEKRVKERTKELEEFVYTISHDLKSPLYTAKSFAEIIDEQLAERFESEEDRYILRRIGENIESAIKMINDLLNLSRVGTAKMKVERIELKNIINEYLVQFKAVNKSGIKLNIKLKEGSVPVYGDKGRILQLLTNLFDNSVKYRKSNYVDINVSSEKMDGEVRITVEDNGIGIDKDEIDKIFNVFYRGRAALDRKIEGSGCGLTIVKKIVDMHGGNISVESNPGKGTMFIITLPDIR